MKAILGRKVGMARMFTPQGEAVGVTLISCAPNQVVLFRSKEKDGYEAVQIGLPGNSSKRQFAVKREFPIELEKEEKLLTVTQFEPGELVQVAGVSKGKGFQGVVKRHGFKGGPASHGHRHVLRKGGSIGSAFPQHVIKGKKMAGRMGSDRVTIKNLLVAWIDSEKNLLALKGAIPGTRGSVVEIVSS